MRAEDQIRLRALEDFEFYAEQFLKVLDKQTLRLVPLRLKPVQIRLARHIIEAWRSGKPVRIIILKARREGVSTVIQALFFWLAAQRSHQVAVTLSHHDDTTKELFAISERYHQHLPGLLRPKKKQTRRGQVLEFANPTKNEDEARRNPGLMSVIRTVTAKNAGAGQGANLVHCSEVGLWDENAIDAKKVLDTLLQIVPTEAGTIVCLESTARGVGNEFHRRWKAAERSQRDGVEDFYPFFIPWFEEITNVIAGPHDLGELDEEEERLVQRFGLSDDQLAWRRYAIRALCGGDVDTFHQEYPASPDEAFLSSGRPYFDQETVSKCLEVARECEPYAVGDLVEDESKVWVKEARRGRLAIWEPRQDYEDYLIACDSSEGSGGDPQHAYVFKRSSLSIVAAWHGRVDRDELGDILFLLGKLYDNAQIAVEINGGWGLTPIAILRRRGYTRLYRKIDQNRIASKKKRDVRWGWDTTPTNRPLVLDALNQAIRLGELDCPDPQLFEECLTFVYSATGKPEAMTGAHDDRVLAAAIGVYLWQTEPVRHPEPVEQPQRRVLSELTAY